MIGLSDIKTGIDILEKLTGWVRDLRARLSAARSTQPTSPKPWSNKPLKP